MLVLYKVLLTHVLMIRLGILQLISATLYQNNFVIFNTFILVVVVAKAIVNNPDCYVPELRIKSVTVVILILIIIDRVKKKMVVSKAGAIRFVNVWSKEHILKKSQPLTFTINPSTETKTIVLEEVWNLEEKLYKLI